ncbi:disulfide bond formation protein DsbA [Rhodovulum sulfidophilum]|uniref:Thioredoxin domain-containing protein n=1 Tax=Rhodovulum sulfidophilum TaxID=35806 RepID=A0ABS1RUY3_RHOSU|nr:DsbA family protein [Rhodovulum sulfidophilum]MBK5924473.1 disulfide bond formation protein DsbA [Rhodovulum sulfidophilum]MBL3586221.1 thioredoxin domain-containing protein [Rhodovulum sulfidophilum]MBL3609884.1 thioredoxin domain-containing protein [Rhodovulum sulfidophilum]MCE8442091.1 DsbA family protein [Rhodovulum sulfidophilum]MCE8455939.1 DsbA family protein [Rhodovulum sulfidophilum]
MTRMTAAALMALGLAAPLAAPLAAQAEAFDLTDMSAAERTAFRAEVRSYLMDNPEVLMEAIGVLEQRQANAQAQNDETLVRVNAEDIFEDGVSWVGGNPEGDVTLVEFTDYRCTYCRKSYSEVSDLVASDGNIRFVVKEFPILGEQSVLSSRFAIAVKQLAGDAAYEKIHDALITFRGNVSDESLKRLAEENGLDAAAVLERMKAPEVEKVIADNHALAQRLQISGTPTFILGDQMIRGYVPLEGMKQLVEDARAD